MILSLGNMLERGAKEYFEADIERDESADNLHLRGYFAGKELQKFDELSVDELEGLQRYVFSLTAITSKARGNSPKGNEHGYIAPPYLDNSLRKFADGNFRVY